MKAEMEAEMRVEMDEEIKRKRIFSIGVLAYGK